MRTVFCSSSRSLEPSFYGLVGLASTLALSVLCAMAALLRYGGLVWIGCQRAACGIEKSWTVVNGREWSLTAINQWSPTRAEVNNYLPLVGFVPRMLWRRWEHLVTSLHPGSKKSTECISISELSCLWLSRIVELRPRQERQMMMLMTDSISCSCSIDWFGLSLWEEFSAWQFMCWSRLVLEAWKHP